jgi:hypothetical protein
VVLHENEVGFNLVVMKGRAIEPTLHTSAHWRSTANLIPNARSTGLTHSLDATGRRVRSSP